jgi:hypothetical protein
MGEEEDFVVWRPASLISLDEYFNTRRSRKGSNEPQVDQGVVVDSVTVEKKSNQSPHVSKVSTNLTSKRSERRRSLQHLISMDDSTKPPPAPSPRTTPNQRRRKKSAKQHSFAMKELVDMFESPSQSPATVHDRKYRLSNGTT